MSTYESMSALRYQKTWGWKHPNLVTTSLDYKGTVALEFKNGPFLQHEAAADPTFIYWSTDPIALKDGASERWLLVLGVNKSFE